MKLKLLWNLVRDLLGLAALAFWARASLRRRTRERLYRGVAR